MGRLRRVVKAGMSSLIVGTIIGAPVVVSAASRPEPIAGTWAVAAESGNLTGSLVVGSDRTEVKSLTFDVASDDVPAGCPTGTFSLPGPLPLKNYNVVSVVPFAGWAFGKVVLVTMRGQHFKRFQEARVSGATLDGKPYDNVALDVQFDFGSAQNERIAGGELDLDAKGIKPAYGDSRCDASLGELQPTSAVPRVGEGVGR